MIDEAPRQHAGRWAVVLMLMIAAGSYSSLRFAAFLWDAEQSLDKSEPYLPGLSAAAVPQDDNRDVGVDATDNEATEIDSLAAEEASRRVWLAELKRVAAAESDASLYAAIDPLTRQIHFHGKLTTVPVSTNSPADNSAELTVWYAAAGSAVQIENVDWRRLGVLHKDDSGRVVGILDWPDGQGSGVASLVGLSVGQFVSPGGTDKLLTPQFRWIRP